MVEVVFVLFVSLAGQPFAEVGRYTTADDCRNAVEMLEMIERAPGGDWRPGEASGACLVIPRPRE